MNFFVRAAASAALAVAALPAFAQSPGYTPPPGYVLVPAPPPQQPPPGYQLQPVQQERSFAIGVSAGAVFPGKFYAGDYTLDTKTALRFGAYADFFLANKFSMGLFADRLSFGLKDSDRSVDFTSLGLTFVGHFGPAHEGHLRLGLGLSYEMGSSDGMDGSSGFGIRAFLGYVAPIGPSSAFFVQGMVQGAPSGGNGTIDVTYGPLWSLNAGVEFGK
jgi:hypothetical protein